MEFEKLVSPSLKDLFITHVEAMILSGELPVGQQLPPERQLAQSMGVSRAVVNSGVAISAETTRLARKHKPSCRVFCSAAALPEFSAKGISAFATTMG